MNISSMPGANARFRRTPWRFQQTIERPAPDELDTFVSTFISAHDGIAEATVTIDSIIFDAHHLTALVSPTAELSLSRDSSITAHTAQEVHVLLKAALEDWIDFFFVPTPNLSSSMQIMMNGSRFMQIPSLI